MCKIKVMDIAHKERHYGIFAFRLSKKPHSIDIPKPFHTIPGQFPFVCGDTVETYFLHIVDGFGQTVSGYIVRRTGLNLNRRRSSHSSLP